MTAVAQFVQSFGEKLLGKECSRALLTNMDFKNFKCLKLAVSKGLGVGIIGGAMVVKVPQILKILASRSTEGLSFLSVVLETLAASITFAYNFRAGNSFTTYGETFFMTIQNVLLLLLLGLYRKQSMRLLLLFCTYSVLMSSLLIPTYATDATLKSLQAATIPLTMVSRLPQIWTVWRQGGTGQLSALSVGLVWIGSLARVYTSMQETGEDRLLVLGFVMAALLNSTIMWQMVYYWKTPTAPMKKKQKPKRA
ncbi:Monosaccharide-P-dolichol utilization protein [Paramicrosporidium saccamoebae]|uniref:Mannose-P-dolichol utilization defect 1 protein homolog n=1 Tax=Paramicrosporidium saccamoebae TaxID=1246581 RepID=A0A2H9TGM7_9FUNG|nr:Monosaccharide-P-dolichol utilization protein [Paramicrosporidium saccamoebae]